MNLNILMALKTNITFDVKTIFTTIIFQKVFPKKSLAHFTKKNAQNFTEQKKPKELKKNHCSVKVS